MNRWLPLVCTLLYVVLFVLVHGYFFHVDAMLLLFHLHPFFLLPPDVQYLHGSPLVPIVAHYLGIAGYVSMRLFYLLLVCVAVCSIYFYTKDLAEKEKEEEQGTGR